jgi:uncharacterized protein
VSKTARIVLFLISFALLVVVFLTTTGSVFPSDEPSVVIFTALLMLSFVTLFLEHYFTRPTDVLASTIAIVLLLAPLSHHLTKFGIWYWLLFAYNGLLLTTSLIALLLVDDNKSSVSLQNRASLALKRFSVFFGNGRFLFFLLFFCTLVFYVDNQSNRFLVLAAYAIFVLLVDPKEFALATWRSRMGRGLDIGEIIRRSGKKYLSRKAIR